ncbi:MAG TPA: hypothetical protein VKR53_11095 [Puia sp.]|nr:hypothetical protein [Puia sp.]
MKYTMILLFGAAALSGCKDQKPALTAAEQTEKKSFFPVVDFLKGQIHYVDSLPTAILKIVTENNKRDSSYIKRSEFDKLAQDFILPDLRQDVFEANFKESSFIDQTTQSATFNYTSANPGLSLQRVDVLATPDELYSKVKSIFIQQTLNKSDTIIVKKLYWQSNKHFQMATILQVAGQPRKTNQLQVTWDAGE